MHHRLETPLLYIEVQKAVVNTSRTQDESLDFSQDFESHVVALMSLYNCCLAISEYCNSGDAYHLLLSSQLKNGCVASLPSSGLPPLRLNQYKIPPDPFLPLDWKIKDITRPRRLLSLSEKPCRGRRAMPKYLIGYRQDWLRCGRWI